MNEQEKELVRMVGEELAKAAIIGVMNYYKVNGLSVEDAKAAYTKAAGMMDVRPADELPDPEVAE